MMILSTSTSFEAFFRSIVAHELMFYLAAVVLVVLTAESCIKLLKRDSFGITVGVYVTVFAWYFADPFINPEQYDDLPSSSLGQSYGQVVLFLIGFRVFAPVAIRWIVRRRSSGVFDTRLTPEQILRGVAAIWLVLFILGIARIGGDVMGAVLPLGGRAGATMWGRGAVESSAIGFLITFAGYLFMAVTAFLGVLVFFQRSTGSRLFAGAMFAITLPNFFFSGTRSGFLAVTVPFMITYLFYGRRLLILKLAILAIAFFCLKEGFRFVQVFRLGGFREVLASENAYEFMDERDEDVRTVGLNMIQELCFVNDYLDSGETSPAYGARYLNELLNFVPRAIWPSKPLLGIDYAIWRGYQSDDSELGVNTTISSGMIGGGVLNFGQILGPVAASILMAIWSGLLIRWWEQRQSLLRMMLFMLGAGLTFNLGRDITLLVLWPVVFAYFFVRLAEIWATRRFYALPQTATVAPADARPALV
jgi:oligosaccharide repeat unit polymerase